MTARLPSRMNRLHAWAMHMLAKDDKLMAKRVQKRISIVLRKDIKPSALIMVEL